MNVITGIGWVAQREYGCVMKKLRRSYADIGSLRSEMQDKSLFSYPVKGFGKHDLVSKMTCCVAALALYDAGIPYSNSQKQDIGILGTNTNGCLQSNLDFFRDFVRSGRKLGRGNLFIYTLPSIPLAEAAIYLKCRGPVLYMAFSQRQVPSLLSEAARMIDRGESRTMLAVKAGEEDALCFVLRRQQDVSTERLFNLEETVDIAETISPLDEMIEVFASMQVDINASGVLQVRAEGKGMV